jgi:hypothetical protein
MKKFLFIFWVFIWSPGYILMYMRYFFPDKGRFSASQVQNTRHLKRKHLFAPMYALGIYFLIFFFLGIVGL